MSLTTEQRTAIERAKAKAREEAIGLQREYFGETFDLRFMPAISQDGIDIIVRVQDLVDAGDASVPRQMQAMAEFLDTMALPETADLLAELAKAGIVTPQDLMLLQRDVIAEVAARPTTRSSSSPSGSPTTGNGSTASAPSEASIPPA